MEFQRPGPEGTERPVALDERGRALDLSPVTADIDGERMAGDWIAAVREALPALSGVDTAGPRVGPPVARPGKVVRIGLNHSDRAEDRGTPPPGEVGDPRELSLRLWATDRLGRQRHVVGRA